MKEMFEDLIADIEARTMLNAEYMESDFWFGIVLHDSTRKVYGPVAQLGICGGQIRMLALQNLRHGPRNNTIERHRDLCEPGDPIKIMKKFLKKYVLTEGELNNWLTHDMAAGMPKMGV